MDNNENYILINLKDMKYEVDAEGNRVRWVKVIAVGENIVDVYKDVTLKERFMIGEVYKKIQVEIKEVVEK